MGCIASVNPGVASLLQTLSSNEPSLLSSMLSSPTVESALESSSPADVVQLSNQVLQLQAIDELFGTPDTSTTSSTLLAGLFSPDSLADTSSILQSVDPALLGPAWTDSSASAAAIPDEPDASQLVAYSGALQTQELHALFGIAPATGSNSLDVLA